MPSLPWGRQQSKDSFCRMRIFFLLTTLPCLFLVREDAVRPLAVLALVPRKTKTFANLPLAILLTNFFFMARIAFMAAMAFIAFIALAIVSEKWMFGGAQSL